MLESGILDPNDEPRGSLVQYRAGGDSLQFDKVLIDSLLRPFLCGVLILPKTGKRSLSFVNSATIADASRLYRPSLHGVYHKALIPVGSDGFDERRYESQHT